MTIGLVGDGPAAAAVEAALGDGDQSVERIAPDELAGAHAAAVAVDRAGARTFQEVNERALAADVAWFAVELGGVGGYPVVDAAVIGFDPAGACYECLVSRVASNVPADADPVSPPRDATARLAGATAGHRVVDFLTPAEPDHLGELVEVPHAERTVLPVPGCDCGDGVADDLETASGSRTVDESLSRAQRGLDERVGLVSTVGEAESYPAPYYLAQLCDTSAFADESAGRQAAGVDVGWDAAFMKALGEGFERYCAGVYRRGAFTHGSVADVADPVAPSAVVAPDDWAVDDGADRPWVRGEALGSDERVSLPAELVHYPPPERTTRPAVTTGLGLGNGTVEALLSGLYEVLERDAATVAWYSTYEPLGLAVDDERYRQLAARAGAAGLDATALLLTQDVDVPVVAVAVRRDEWPKLALGTAAHLDPARAARNALAEAVQNWVELRELGPEGAGEAEGAIGRYADSPGEAGAFVDPDQRVPAGSVGPDTVPEGVDHLAEVLTRVDDAGLSAYAARTTTRDVRDLGFEAVRVVVPAAQPLFFGEPYFGSRAETVPESLGFEPRLDRDHHPYP